MPKRFEDIEYLKDGTKRQQQAYSLLNKHRILSRLKGYSPILVGTIPINIDIENSDLDITCYFTDKEEFIHTLEESFSGQYNFEISENPSNNAVIANFVLDDFEIEIFGQNIPTKGQDAYRHMIIENELLEKRGSDFRNQIVELKKQGYKTEPAFAITLGLSGNPYIELLKLEKELDKNSTNS